VAMGHGMIRLAARLIILALVVAISVVTSSAGADSPPRIDSFAEGWSWFMAKRQSHPLMRKMGPYLAAEWWQRVEKQALWPGRTGPYETGIEVDSDGLVAVTVLLDGPEAWKGLAALLEPSGSAHSPTDLTPTGATSPPPAHHGAPEGNATSQGSVAQPARPNPALAPIAPRRREGTGDVPMTVIPVPQNAPQNPNLESVEPPPALTWTVYARIPMQSIGTLAIDPHVIRILDPGRLF
jgi:hypothetical protein